MERDDLPSLGGLLGDVVSSVESCVRKTELLGDTVRVLLSGYNTLVLELRAQVRLMRNCVNCRWSVAADPSPGCSCPEQACLCPRPCEDLSCWAERGFGGIDG